MTGRILFVLSLAVSWVVIALFGAASSIFLLEYRTKFTITDESIHGTFTTSKTFTLSDGRQLGYKIYGNPKALHKAVIYFHGTPGSRQLVPPTLRYWPETAQHLILAFDRPGYGLSDYDDQFSFESVCNDIAELVEHLRLDAFVLAGISTGADFALACGLHESFATKLKGILMVSPAVPPNFNDDAYRFNPAMKVLISREMPLFVLRGFAVLERALLQSAFHQPEMLEETVMTKPDKAFATGNAEFLMSALKDSYRNSSLGTYRDLATLIYGDWSFLNNVDDLPTKNIVTLHGELDRSINWTAGMDLCDLVPHCYFDLREDEGHLSIMGTAFMWQMSNMFDPVDIERRESELTDMDIEPDAEYDGVGMEDIANTFEES